MASPRLRLQPSGNWPPALVCVSRMCARRFRRGDAARTPTRRRPCGRAHRHDRLRQCAPLVVRPPFAGLLRRGRAADPPAMCWQGEKPARSEDPMCETRGTPQTPVPHHQEQQRHPVQLGPGGPRLPTHPSSKGGKTLWLGAMSRARPSHHHNAPRPPRRRPAAPRPPSPPLSPGAAKLAPFISPLIGPSMPTNRSGR